MVDLMPYYCAIHPNEVVDNGAIPCPKCAQWQVRYNQAHVEGVQAYDAGAKLGDNPYMHKGDGTFEAGWRAGWYAQYCQSNPRPPAQYYKQYKE